MRISRWDNGWSREWRASFTYRLMSKPNGYQYDIYSRTLPGLVWKILKEMSYRWT